MRCPCSVMQRTPITALHRYLGSYRLFPPPRSNGTVDGRLPQGPRTAPVLGDLPLSSPSRPLGLFGVV